MELLWFITDPITFAPVVGASTHTRLVVMRESDEFLYNWDLAVFGTTTTPPSPSPSMSPSVAPSPSTSPSHSVSPSSGVVPSGTYVAHYEEFLSDIIPGMYKKVLDITDWPDDTYHIISVYTGDGVSTNKIETFIIKNGTKYNNISESNASDLKTSVDNLALKIIPPPSASLLIQEYYNNEDADGNGLIYGIDFYITIGRPIILDTLPRRGNPMSWTAYLASIGE
jgi:hypothetical protein